MIGRSLPTRVAEQALKAATLRHEVIANNIANVETPGFKRSRVDFEAQLAQALSQGRSPDSVRPSQVVESDFIGRPDGNNVDIEFENVKMAENQIWHAALTRQISDHFARIRMVIDGRR